MFSTNLKNETSPNTLLYNEFPTPFLQDDWELLMNIMIILNIMVLSKNFKLNQWNHPKEYFNVLKTKIMN